LLQQFHHDRKRLPAFFLLWGVALTFSACGFKWPENETLDRDPFSFAADSDDDESATPPPPGIIPKEEPNQTDPAFKFTPTSTMGVNLDTYFVQDIQDPVKRMQRLENVVLAMHKDLQNLSRTAPPPKTQSFEKEIMPAPAEPAPGTASVADDNADEPVNIRPQTMAAAEAKVAPVPRPGAAGDGVSITDIRIGEHPEKIRIVFDTSAGTAFKADLDNGEHLLIVEFPEARWQSSAASKYYGKIPLLQSYRAEPFNDNRGTRVVLELKHNTAIVNQDTYPALAGAGARIVIDLSK
jgi:hypothetical protein